MDRKKIAILDGQGGGFGRRLAENLILEKVDSDLIVVGTNAVATSNMMKAGVKHGATGENAWIYNCEKVDIIIGPIGILIENSMYGEISQQMSSAVMNSNAEKVILPISNDHIYLVGVGDKKLSEYIEEMDELVIQIIN